MKKMLEIQKIFQNFFLQKKTALKTSTEKLFIKDKLDDQGKLFNFKNCQG